ncbi:hypothetical protein PL79_018930 [Burkholderia sp. USMB20]|nr:hypothetical protein PL79_018930 [Burkholderia sp. USMB20]
MGNFAKKWRGVPKGGIYPVQYVPGDECPDELEGAAAEAGVLEGMDKPAISQPAPTRGRGK